MLITVLKRNNYQDSINLMLLTNVINDLDSVNKSQIMMGTEANKEILNNVGLLSKEAKAASPNDMVIVVDAKEDVIMDDVLIEVEKFLNDLSIKKEQKNIKDVTNWDEAFKQLPNANLALFSIPGEYGASEMEVALDRGLHVFSFTDNISLEDEIKLKIKAHEKGLLMMGPDCGTGIISSIPIAFTNVVNPGNIGIVGASGTGIQEVTTIIDRLGGGCVHAIGTGGRDLNKSIGAITVKDVIIALEHHDSTDVIVVISKPPGKEVRDDVVNLLQSCKKPVVAIFLGEKPLHHEGNVYLAHTLEETAQIAMDLSKGKGVKKNYFEEITCPIEHPLASMKTMKGLYSGGTLGAEAGMLISEALDLGGLIKQEGFILKAQGYEVIDLGDDIYTQGKPHPMIDPEVRINKIKQYARQEDTAVILLDIVLGYGCHPDMAGALLPVITEELKQAKEDGRDLYFVATVVGTAQDPQDYNQAVETLKSCGVLVQPSNAKAVQLALKLKGLHINEADKEIEEYTKPLQEVPAISHKIMELLNTKPRIINVGIESFQDSIVKYGGEAVQFTWRPKAGGNKKLIKILNALDGYDKEINEFNDEVIMRMKDSQPFLVDVVPAKDVISVLNTEHKTLLHAGPPIAYEEMTGPMQGSCIGALLFEGWAVDEASARSLLESGEVNFTPCHHAHAVGPMGGITSANMPVLVVENRLDMTTAYCTMNEGIGKVLRFGAFSKEVVDRLTWMKEVLGPTLSKAIKLKENGINLNVILAKAITMGDEFHQRNIAASLIFLKEIAPYILDLDINQKHKLSVTRFLADTDQFFLNIMMATGKSIADCARKVTKGTVVTALTRNGKDFGVRISGMGDEWFTAPVNTPKGLYFTGFTEEDGNADIGDSSITETVGVGAMAMIAAPGVTRFVGAGGFEDALAISNEMSEICITHNSNFSIPTWDFKGTCLGIDIRKVVEKGITPIINTGIAHKKPGIGQVGAGTVRAPLACFEKALVAYAKKLGIEID
jgi:succinyl-CoA synthetase alpha subunit